MLTRQRKELLLKILREDGQIVAKTLSEKLGLSEDTIRRDLRELAKEGLLERVHGGALPASPAIGNFAQRQQISADCKPAIGRAAAAMVQHEVRWRNGQQHAGHATDDEGDDETNGPQHRHFKTDAAAVHGEQPVEDLGPGRDRDNHRGNAEERVHAGAGAHGEEVVQPYQ
eukprot:gene30803-34763_t